MQKISIHQFIDWTMVLVISCTAALICNWLGNEKTIMTSLPGMLWLFFFTLAGIVIKEMLPFSLPAVAYITAIAILFACPISPVQAQVIHDVEQVSLIALCTPVLAYAGVTIGHDWDAFKSIGFRGILVSVLVILGTVLACVVLSEILFYIF